MASLQDCSDEKNENKGLSGGQGGLMNNTTESKRHALRLGGLLTRKEAIQLAADLQELRNCTGPFYKMMRDCLAEYRRRQKNITTKIAK